MTRMLLFFIVYLNVTATFGQHSVTPDWLIRVDSGYQKVESLEDIGNTVYLDIDFYKNAGAHLVITSAETFFLFRDGKVLAESVGSLRLNLDSLRGNRARSMFAVYQSELNPRSLDIVIQSGKKSSEDLITTVKPPSDFRNFVVFAGLLIIVLFVLIINLNPKLASDYFSIIKIFSLREVDDAQSNARLTSSANIQFYFSCSLLIAFFMMMVLRHLPPDYALPLKFGAESFLGIFWQWIRLTLIVLLVFGIKIFLVFNLTRLFDMKGLARVHFFNWVRLMIMLVGVCTVILFIYFINRGNQPGFFVTFLIIAVTILTGWIAIVYLKLNGKTDHSLFHLFSYICATEIIPLVITVKILFQ